MNRFESAALDRHITGNYGEDQFRQVRADVRKRARVAAGRPLVCACAEYEWLHRAGFGNCSTNRQTATSDMYFYCFINGRRREGKC